MRFRNNLAKSMFFLGLPALLVLAYGCGLDRAPVAPEEESLAPGPQGGALLAFSPQGVRRAARMAMEPAAGERGEGVAFVSRTERRSKPKRGKSYSTRA